MDPQTRGHGEMNFQLQSPFFKPPREIRDIIYGLLSPPARIHMSLQNRNHGRRRLVFSPCVRREGKDQIPVPKPDPYGSYGQCRKEVELLYWERSRSPWGMHWRCDEWVTDSDFYVNNNEWKWTQDSEVWMNYLKVCKRMFADILEYVGDENLVVKGCLVANLKALEINMILPLSTYTAIERANASTPAPAAGHSAATSSRTTPAEPSSPPSSSQVSAWSQLFQTLLSMSRLRSLRISLDHDEPHSWSLVHERAFLAPLETLLIQNPTLSISITLPTLHPKYETSSRHYIPLFYKTAPSAWLVARRSSSISPSSSTSPSNPSPLTKSITRNYRRLRRALSGTPTHDLFYDFPEHVHYLDLGFWEMSIEQGEADEREAWAQGCIQVLKKRWEVMNREMEEYFNSTINSMEAI
ncbi:hypothetical protein BCR34DRAFT_337022 [Clohesyomyces aquaticus]|uniref:DUF7730 domain-containing protein n=1 Tax=Clohesyomyces aquaticus TaxID=1231657 RepID=A0A1Y1ZL50_9PLEO|nr:hypothetical protein BCR34DRAFT_337022 [Clohesyomyces aquaticus]